MSEQIIMPTESLQASGETNREVPPKIQKLHDKALAAVARMKAAEIELLQVLDEVEGHKAYLRYGYNSLYQYAVKALGLSEGVAYNFINVGRKAREIPELKKEIATGALSVSKARKITSVLTSENSSKWIELAKSASQHQVEREVSLANPGESGRGRMSYVPPQNEIAEKVVIKNPSEPRVARVQLEVGISEKLMIKIRRAQGVLGQKLRRGATLEQTLEAMVEVYLSRHDPTERAKRQLISGKLGTSAENSGAPQAAEGPEVTRTTRASQSPQTENTTAKLRFAKKTSSSQFSRTAAEMGASKSGGRVGRRSLPSATKHRVLLKFQSRCSHVDRRGERCQETKFLEIHHLRPLREGGDDRLENLTLLCSGHHKGIHLG